MRGGAWLLVGWVIVATASIVAAEERIGWPEAVALLREERGQAELCASIVKRHARGAALEHAATAYGEAKTEYDAIIAGLEVALAGNHGPASLPNLEMRLRKGFERRTEFCEQAKSLLPSKKPGEKGVVEEIVKGAVGPVVEAIEKIVNEALQGPPRRRDTIRTQLEAATWPSFASVSPSS